MMKATDKHTLSYYMTSFFKKYLPGQKNLSPNTIRAYADAFKLLLIYCEEEKGIKSDRLKLENIDRELVSGFLDWLEEIRGCKTTTRNQRLIALHSFCRYVQKISPENMDNLQSVIQIDYKKSKKAIVPYLTEKQMKLLLAQPDGNTWQLFRDKVMLAVLYDTGARVQELCDLRIKDVRLESPAVITLTGKGNKVRQVPIMSGTQKLLKIYLEKHKGNAGIILVVNYEFRDRFKPYKSLFELCEQGRLLMVTTATQIASNVPMTRPEALDMNAIAAQLATLPVGASHQLLLKRLRPLP